MPMLVVPALHCQSDEVAVHNSINIVASTTTWITHIIQFLAELCAGGQELVIIWEALSSCTFPHRHNALLL